MNEFDYYSKVDIEAVTRWVWYCPECGDENEADPGTTVDNRVVCGECGGWFTVRQVPR